MDRKSFVKLVAAMREAEKRFWIGQRDKDDLVKSIELERRVDEEIKRVAERLKANPAGEFKKGHRLTPELEEKRIEALKRHYLLNPSAAREKAMKAWQTRREKQAS